MIQCKHYNNGLCKVGAGGGKPSFGFCFQICRGSVLLQPKQLEWAELKHPELRQVITGTDANQEWLLEHWYEAYRKHCSYPVTFVDFGMTPEGRSWCEARGNVVEVKDDIPPMYRKPMSFLKSEYGYNVWLDLDTEVTGDISPMFDFSGEHTAKFRLDHEWTLRTHEVDHLQAGVCSFKHGSELIRRWASYSALGLDNRSFCPDPHNVQDQQVLAWVRRKFQMPYQYLPHRFNWMMFEPKLGHKPIVIHWAGAKGKETLRQKIATGKAEIVADEWTTQGGNVWGGNPNDLNKLHPKEAWE